MGVERRRPSYTLGRNIKSVQPLCRTVQRLLKKLKIEFAMWFSSTIPGHIPRQSFNRFTSKQTKLLVPKRIARVVVSRDRDRAGVWDLQIHTTMYKTNKDSLYSTRKYIWYLAMIYSGKESEKVYICVYIYIHIHIYITYHFSVHLKQTQHCKSTIV